MPRYGQFLYGAPELYGTGAGTDNLLWTFQVDWKGDLSYAPPSRTFNNEALRMVDLTVRRGRDYMLAANNRGFERMATGEVVGIFDNNDGRYDPWNVDGPLYGYLYPGKYARISVRDGAGGTDYSIMRGLVDDIQPIMRNGSPHARIIVKDGSGLLKQFAIRRGLTTNATKSSIKNTIAVLGGWNSTEWPVVTTLTDVGQEQLAFWWAWDEPAWDLLNDLNDAEIGAIFHSRTGTLVWRPRDYTYLRTYDLDESQILRDFALPQPWHSVRNDIRAQPSPMIYETVTAQLWYLSDVPIPLADGETFSVDAILKYSTWQPCGRLTDADVVVNAQEDGLGADLSASCPITVGTQSEGVELSVVNNSGTDGFIISFVVNTTSGVSGVVYAPSTSICRAVDAASQAAYGTKSLVLDSKWMVDTAIAQTVSDWLIGELATPQAQPIIIVEARPEIQFYLDVWDQIVLTLSSKGLEGYKTRVGGLDHQWLVETGQAVRTTFHLEPYLTPYVAPPSDPAYYGALATSSSAQSISADTWTAVNFATEDHDTNAFHTFADRLQIPANLGGRYFTYANVTWGQGTAGTLRAVRIVNQDSTVLAYAESNPAASQLMTQNLHVITDLEAGDYLRVQVYTSEAAPLWATEGYKYFGLFWLNEEA